MDFKSPVHRIVRGPIQGVHFALFRKNSYISELT